jgi:hypothetical protein
MVKVVRTRWSPNEVAFFQAAFISSGRAFERAFYIVVAKTFRIADSFIANH